MDVISAFFLDGRIAYLVLVVMLVEALVLIGLSRRNTTFVSATKIVAALLPGFFLVLALLAALIHAEWFWTAFALIGALITHFVDMRLRFKSRASQLVHR